MGFCFSKKLIKKRRLKRAAQTFRSAWSLWSKCGQGVGKLWETCFSFSTAYPCLVHTFGRVFRPIVHNRHTSIFVVSPFFWRNAEACIKENENSLSVHQKIVVFIFFLISDFFVFQSESKTNISIFSIFVFLRFRIFGLDGFFLVMCTLTRFSVEKQKSPNIRALVCTQSKIA